MIDITRPTVEEKPFVSRDRIHLDDRMNFYFLHKKISSPIG